MERTGDRLVSGGGVESHLYSDSGMDGTLAVVSALGVPAGTRLSPEQAVEQGKRGIGGVGEYSTRVHPQNAHCAALAHCNPALLPVTCAQGTRDWTSAPTRRPVGIHTCCTPISRAFTSVSCHSVSRSV